MSMKKDGKYRYTLQFSENSEENIQAGELLERLGNKKSIVIVAALNEYLIHHPELQNSDCRIKVCITPTKETVPENWEQIIMEMINRKLGSIQQGESQGLPGIEAGQSVQESMESENLEEDILAMLGNLDIFNQ